MKKLKIDINNIRDLDWTGLSKRLEETMLNRVAVDLVKTGTSIEEVAVLYASAKENIQKKKANYFGSLEENNVARTAMGIGGLGLLGVGLHSILGSDHTETPDAPETPKSVEQHDVKVEKDMKKPDVRSRRSLKNGQRMDLQ